MVSSILLLIWVVLSAVVSELISGFWMSVWLALVVISLGIGVAPYNLVYWVILGLVYLSGIFILLLYVSAGEIGGFWSPLLVGLGSLVVVFLSLDYLFNFGDFIITGVAGLEDSGIFSAYFGGYFLLVVMVLINGVLCFRKGTFWVSSQFSFSNSSLSDFWEFWGCWVLFCLFELFCLLNFYLVMSCEVQCGVESWKSVFNLYCQGSLMLVVLFIVCFSFLVWLSSIVSVEGVVKSSGLDWLLVGVVSGVVFSSWLMDNLLGLLGGDTISMGYLSVLIVGVLLWFWGESMKIFSAGVVDYGAHFSILGLSGGLTLFLPLMEVFSVMIRPLTLSVRLSTNITSGHVLMLMVALFMGSGVLSGVSLLLLGWILGVLEIFVCFLQAGVFSMLIMVYLES